MNSDGFVTQLENGLPRLLVISLQSDHVWLASLLGNAASFGLQGELKTLENVDEQYFQENEIYKVVVVTPVEELTAVTELIDRCGSMIRHLSRVVFIVYGAQWQIQQSEALWSDLYNKIERAVPKSSVVTIFDCLGVGGIGAPLLEQWRATLTTSTSSSTELLDPVQTLYPLSKESFTKRVQDILVRPLASGRFQVRGEAVSSSEVVGLVSAGVGRLGAPLPHIRALPTPPLDASLLGTILIEGEDSSVSLGTQAALQLAVTAFISSLERLSFTQAEPTPNVAPLPLPSREQHHKPPVTPRPVVTAQPIESLHNHQPQDHQQPVVPVVPKEPSVHEPAPKVIEKPVKALKPITEASIDKAVNELFIKERTEEKSTHIRTTAKETKAVVHKLKRRKRVYWGGLLLLGVSLAFVFVGSVFGSTYWFVQNQLQEQVARIAENPTSFTATSQPQTAPSEFLMWQSTALNAVFPLEVFEDASRLATLNTLTTRLPTRITDWQNGVGAWASTLFSGETAASLETISQLSAQEEQLYADLSSLTAGLKTVDDTGFTESQKANFKQFDELLVKQRRGLAAFQQITPLFSQVFGYQQTRTYAIVFQNPQELRPTGGFLQSVALVTFDKGLLVDTQVISSYELDKNLLGSVQPPADMQRFLGEQRWFLRDANWNPNFPTAATDISWFIEHTARRSVDGVIAVDAYAWQAIIKSLGPIEVPEYNEVITDKNILERLEFHSELIFEQGQPKTEYSTLLFTKLLTKLKTAPPDKMALVITAMGEKTTNGNVLVWLKEPSEASVMSNLGLDGSLLSPSCPDQFNTETCVVETVAQFEANVGVNKANAHLEKSTSHNVTLERGKATHARTTTYKNTANTAAWPKGPYKAYIRWYLSPTATEISVQNGQSIIPANQLIISEEAGKKVVGAFIEVPVQQTAQLTLAYSTQFTAPNEFSYALFSQRQPGLDKNQETISITHSSQIKPKLIIPQALVKDETIEFTYNNTNGHTFVGATFE